MQIKQTVDCRYAARATISEDGKLNVKVIATAVYDENSKATTSAYLQVPDDAAAAVKAALEAAMKACAPQVATKILDAIHISREVAKREGEIK